MALGLGFDNRRRTVAQATIDLGHAKFQLAGKLRRRILFWALPFVPLAALALYLRQPIGGLLAILFGAFVTLWQFLAYGLTGGQISPEQLEVTRLYPKWALIAAALFWTTLLTVVCVALYLKFPDG